MNKEKFLKSELKSHNLELNPKIDGREGVDFLIGDNQIHLQSIDLDTVQRSIKLSKQDLGELRNKLFVALVLIVDKEPKVVYLIPSEDLSQSNSNIFINNDIIGRVKSNKFISTVPIFHFAYT